MLKKMVAVAIVLAVASISFAKSKSEFEKTLKNVETVVNGYDKENFYEKFEFTNKKTGKPKKFLEFTPVQRAVFIAMQMNAINHSIEEIYNKWQEELKGAEEHPSEEGEASKKEVEEYLTKLMEFRKAGAVKLESSIDSTFEKWPDEFTDEEKENIKKNMREYHDKNHLIKRDAK